MSEHVQVSSDRKTVWVHAEDGSTVGRFSAAFGMDVHRTAAQQLAGRGQCLMCTHEPPTAHDWWRFRFAMRTQYKIKVPRDAIDLRTLKPSQDALA